MRKPKLPPGSPDDTEHAFYDALQHADLERLMACWADEDDILCVHPGGPRLVGHAAIRASFEALLAQGGVALHPEQVRRLDAGACSVHSVVERLDVFSDDGVRPAWVLATNVYAKTAQGWRLVAHHAGQGPSDGPVEGLALPPVLH
jgi:ketosteroid isomerase-like protein